MVSPLQYFRFLNKGKDIFETTDYPSKSFVHPEGVNCRLQVAGYITNSDLLPAIYTLCCSPNFHPVFTVCVLLPIGDIVDLCTRKHT